MYFLDPQLFALWSRPGHHQYDGLRDKKTLFLFITSSLFAAVLWTVLIMIFSYLGVLPYLTAILIGSLILISFLIIGSISIATLLKGLIVVINNLEVFAYIATVIMILTLLLSMTL